MTLIIKYRNVLYSFCAIHLVKVGWKLNFKSWWVCY